MGTLSGLHKRRLRNLGRKREQGPFIRRRLALVWPRVRNVGVVLGVVDGGKLVRASCGTVPSIGLGQILDTFGAEVVYLPSGWKHPVSLDVGNTGEVVWYPVRTTPSYPLPPELRRNLGPLAKKAWSKAIYYWAIKGPILLAQWEVEPLTNTWLETHGRRKDERKPGS